MVCVNLNGVLFHTALGLKCAASISALQGLVSPKRILSLGRPVKALDFPTKAAS